MNSGFVQRGGITHFDKRETVSPQSAALLARLGGAVPTAGQWQQIAGMIEEKTLIERRIVLPLSQPEEAADHGVIPPRAIVLFGPPGTGGVRDIVGSAAAAEVDDVVGLVVRGGGGSHEAAPSSAAEAADRGCWQRPTRDAAGVEPG